MKLTDRYLGGSDPFEGDRTLYLRSLPAVAHVTRATVTVEPKGGPQFSETFVFGDPGLAGELRAEDWGVMKTPSGSFIEVDFHARRTLAAVDGSNVQGASLEVDIGGTFVEINARGAIGPDGEFTVKSDRRLPGLTVNKFKLTSPSSENGDVDVSKVTVRSVPTNVSVGLGELPPFWTRVGELATAQTSPNFADVLNAFLADAPVENGFYVIPFVVHSDTIARLDVEVNVDYVLEQRVLPAQLPEVTLPYNFSTLPGVDEALTTVDLPRRASPVGGRTGAQIAGTFEPTRVAVGPIGAGPESFPILVSPACSLAQPLQIDKEIALTGVDLPLANTEPGLTGLSVTIQQDADGKPAGEILASAEVSVAKPLPDQSSWGTATLPTPFRILPGQRYWLILQSRVGEAYWNAAAGSPDQPSLQCTRDGGLSWRVAAAPEAPTPLAALFRLRETPERFSVPVQLQIGKEPHAVHRRFDEFAPLGRIEFSFDFAEKLGEYMAGPATAPPCGTGELLVNGDFNDPPPSGVGSAGEQHSWCKPEVPAGWTGLSGRVLRFRSPWTDQLLAALVGADRSSLPEGLRAACFSQSPRALETLTGEPALLSQRVPVGEACSYLLRLEYYVRALDAESASPTSHLSPPRLPRWQIQWLDADGVLLDSDAALLEFESWRNREELPFWPHEARMVAPPEATQAEICFTQPAPGVLVLETVSFSPTLEAVANGSFVFQDAGIPRSWQHQGGQIEVSNGGVLLRGAGPEDAVLVQRVEVVADTRYELDVRARLQSAGEVEDRSTQQRARLELRWLAEESEIGKPVTLPFWTFDKKSKLWHSLGHEYQ